MGAGCWCPTHGSTFSFIQPDTAFSSLPLSQKAQPPVKSTPGPCPAEKPGALCAVAERLLPRGGSEAPSPGWGGQGEPRRGGRMRCSRLTPLPGPRDRGPRGGAQAAASSVHSFPAPRRRRQRQDSARAPQPLLWPPHGASSGTVLAHTARRWEGDKWFHRHGPHPLPRRSQPGGACPWLPWSTERPNPAPRALPSRAHRKLRALRPGTGGWRPEGAGKDGLSGGGGW